MGCSICYCCSLGAMQCLCAHLAFCAATTPAVLCTACVLPVRCTMSSMTGSFCFHATHGPHECNHWTWFHMWPLGCATALQVPIRARAAIILLSISSSTALFSLLTQPSVLVIVCGPAGIDCAPDALQAVAWRLRTKMVSEYALACLLSTACTLVVNQFMGAPSSTHRHVAGTAPKSGPSSSQDAAGSSVQPGQASGSPAHETAQPCSSRAACKQVSGATDPPTALARSSPRVPAATRLDSSSDQTRMIAVGSRSRQSSPAEGAEAGAGPSVPSSPTREPFSSPAPADHQDFAPAAVSPAPLTPAPAAEPAPAPLMTIDLGQLLQEAADARADGVAPIPLYDGPDYGVAFVSSKVCVVASCIIILTLRNLKTITSLPLFHLGLTTHGLLFLSVFRLAVLASDAGE